MKALFAAALLALSTASFAQQDSYTETLNTMFEVSGAYAQYTVGIEQMMEMMRSMYPSIDNADWDALKDEFLNTSSQELVEMLTPVYKKHLTEQDLKDLIAFYQTPAGQKYAAVSPQIMAESMQVGQAWGMSLGEKFAKKLEERQN
ncbi:MAG: DUF2059 domain-containing protein [Flavobacteriales bacterium]